MEEEKASLLSVEQIESFVRKSAKNINIEVVRETTSTNGDLLHKINELAVSTLLVAINQTSGRGRYGRFWHSSPEESLTFSLAWYFHRPVAKSDGLSLAVGVIAARVLSDYGVAVQLKWPNDILHKGQKLGGILVETSVKGAGFWAIIGIGINLALPKNVRSDAQNHIYKTATGAKELLKTDKNRLIADFLNALSEGLTQFEESGFGAFYEKWTALHAHKDAFVCIMQEEKVIYEGVALGVDELGRFILKEGSGNVAVVSGEVSLRLKG